MGIISAVAGLAGAKKQKKIAKRQARAAAAQAKAQKEATETQLMPAELQASIAASASKYLGTGPNATDDFERRVKVANLALKEKDIDTRKEIANLQVVASRQS